jgi:uncharacterized alkaline shock family protein YloU
MKFLDKFILTIFSFIIIVLSTLGILIVVKVLDITAIYYNVTNLMQNQMYLNIALGVFIVLILMAIKALFFRADLRIDEFDGAIKLQNEDGRLEVTLETIEDIVNGVVKSYHGVISNRTIIDVDENMDIFVLETINIVKDTVIKDLSSDLQEKIKEQVKSTIGLEIRNIDIRIKSIVEKRYAKEK